MNSFEADDNPFADYIYERFAQEIRSWPPEEARDIYVIVIYIGFVNDDTRAAQLDLNHNTVSQWQSRISDASSEAEAKWNYAFWSHDAKLTLCKQPYMNSIFTEFEGVDWRGVVLRDAYLTYYLSYVASHMKLNEVKAIIDVCASVTQRLHESGLIRSVCGRSVPVVFEVTNDIGDDELGGHRLNKIREANPIGLTHDYENWT